LITRKILGEEYRLLNPCYLVFSTPLLPRPSEAQIYSSAPYSQHLQPKFLPQCKRPSFTPLQNYRQN
jgi:hypothetical protein